MWVTGERPHPVRELAVGVRRWVVAGILIRLAVLGCHLGQGVLLAGVLAGVLSGGGLAAHLPQLAGVLVLVALRAGLLRGADVVAARAGSATSLHVRRACFAKLAELGPVHVSGARTGELCEAVVAGSEAVETYLGTYVPALVAGVAAPVAACALLAPDDAWLAALVALVCLLVLVVPPALGRPLRVRSRARMDAYLALGAEFLDDAQGIVTLKALAGTAQRRAALSARSDGQIRRWNREMAVALVPGAVQSLGTVGGVVAVGLVAAVRVAEGGLAVGTMFLALLLAREALRPASVLAGAHHASYAARDAADRIRALLQTPPTARAGRPVAVLGEETGPAPPDPGRVAPAVTFTGVHFAYDAAREPVITGLDLHVPAGATVAVVGASGAGKTTLATLLLRFAEPQYGRVLLGDADLRDLPEDRLRSLVALVAQDTYLFGGTVRENLLIARPDADEARLRAATAAAALHADIVALPDGYDTVLGERGTGLSGGQRQRLALARALLADPAVLVLDEATASVDAIAERRIVEELARARTARTTVVIAHRLSTVRGADRIVVLDRGRVAEQGSHDELIRRDGPYAALVAAQVAEPDALEVHVR